MNLIEFDDYINSFLQKENFLFDPSKNGIQIQNREPEKKQIQKIAFAVDASLATIEYAAKQNADVLFVHHGILWGNENRITSAFYKKIALCIENDIALCAYHIPLDANLKYGNNIGIAKKLGLKNVKPFGTWREMAIGVKGILPKPLSLDALSEKIIEERKNVYAKKFSFGKNFIRTVGIISGGAGSDVVQAIAENLDCYITGEFLHEDYFVAQEANINVLAFGHYESEIFGVNLVKEKIAREKKLQTLFIDLPTEL